MQNIAIIGSGIAGLTAARFLNRSFDVRVFEKSRGVGGRVATKRLQDYHFDHGAQFFNAKSKEFKKFITPIIDDNAIAIWKPRFVEMQRDKVISSRIWSDSFPHYVGVPGMTGLAKYIANNLKIYLIAFP